MNYVRLNFRQGQNVQSFVFCNFFSEDIIKYKKTPVSLKKGVCFQCPKGTGMIFCI